MALLFLAVGHVRSCTSSTAASTGSTSSSWPGAGRASCGVPGTGSCSPFALLHGINGLRVVIQDYVRKPQARFLLNWFFYLVGIVIFADGTTWCLTFGPQVWGGGG